MRIDLGGIGGWTLWGVEGGGSGTMSNLNNLINEDDNEEHGIDVETVFYVIYKMKRRRERQKFS